MSDAREATWDMVRGEGRLRNGGMRNRAREHATTIYGTIETFERTRVSRGISKKRSAKCTYTPAERAGRYILFVRVDVEIYSDGSCVIAVRNLGHVDQIYRVDWSGLGVLVRPKIAYQWET